MIDILPGAATESASEIEGIVRTIKADMEQLNTIFTQTAPGMELEWAETVRQNWAGYYNKDFEVAMDEMILAANKLQKAVEVAKEMNQG